MLDQKPYLVRAIYNWILDSGYTPYMQLMVNYPGVDVLVLNISPQATNQLTMGKDTLSFWARFRGQPMGVTAPYSAILAVFAKENGEGMGFDIPDMVMPPQLSVVSSHKGQERQEKQEKDDVVIDRDQQEVSSETDSSPAKRDRSHLRVIK
jgi:stringent starvation protein B